MKRILTAALAISLMGSASEECPADMVPTGVGSCIDRYEWPNRAGELPTVGLSALPEPQDAEAGLTLDADTLCRSVGKRVCRLGEWRSACLYKAGAWPEGKAPANYEPGELACNADKLYRGTVNERAIDKRHPAEFERLDQREPSGARVRCESESGARDMVGNAEEWVRCPGVGKFGWCLMGRYWADPRSCNYTVTVHAPRWHFYETGARCCSEGA